MKRKLQGLICIVIFILFITTGCNKETKVAEDLQETPKDEVQIQEELQIDQEALQIDTNRIEEDVKEEKSAEVLPTENIPPAEAEKQKEEQKIPELKPEVKQEEQSKIPEGPALHFEGSALNQETYISLEALKKMEAAVIEDEYFALNSYGTREYFHFKGVAIGYLIENVIKPSKEAKTVTFIAEDGYAKAYTIQEVKRTDYIDEQNPDKTYKMMIAWEENHQQYDSKKGSPFRLVVGQKEEGDVNKPNWVQNIKTIQID
ncbi:molybdopterin-dependent oxidoreductase [Clostridium formicaceticum]|nr:molybdopterin-dependent oxidoreductase [Clostridium formicaceticum]